MDVVKYENLVLVYKKSRRNEKLKILEEIVKNKCFRIEMREEVFLKCILVVGIFVCCVIDRFLFDGRIVRSL